MKHLSIQKLLMSSRSQLSPLDGRYGDICAPLRDIFSERELVHLRLRIETEYLLTLIGQPEFSAKRIRHDEEAIRSALSNVTADRVFEIENTTRHDVKAVEISMREAIETHLADSAQLSSLIHFGLTSQDINSAAVTLQVREAVLNIIVPAVVAIITRLNSDWCESHRNLLMLSHTHGQPATPTTLGKEMHVYVERLQNALNSLTKHEWSTKFGGATGGFNAHHFVYPNIKWADFGRNFLEKSFQLKRQHPTTQIEHYDGLAAVFDATKRIGTILTDLCSDMWHYISLGYIQQIPKPGSVGSSTMPHKVNPILFENAEGNFMIGGALLEFMSRKLPVSRMQRDLTDSTVTRSIGSAFGYVLIGLTNVTRGLQQIQPNYHTIERDLNNHPEVITEALQTLLRDEGNPTAYAQFHEFCRTTPNLTLDAIRQFICTQYPKSPNIMEMLDLSPTNYRPE